METSTHTTWAPLLEGREASEAWEAIESVARALENPGEFLNLKHTLMDGLPGPALFFGYLSLVTGDESYRRRSLGLLDQAIDELAIAPSDITLMTGFAGLAWSVEHLQGRVCERTGEDLNEGIDDAILQALAVVPETEWPTGHDMMFGVAGMGIYALERLPRGAAKEILERVIERLDRLAERSDDGLAWMSSSKPLPPDLKATWPDGYYNLGVAHGLPGVVGFLGMALAAGFERERLRAMIADAVRWLLARTIPHANGSSFTTFYPPFDAPPARSGWCYGNPAIAACLSIAARAAGDASLLERAQDFALESATRSSHETGIIDPGLCHGAAGLGHILNRFYRATGDERLGQGARFWINHTLQMRRPGVGLAGYLAFREGRGEQEPRHITDPGFLNGISGTGLALLAAVSTVPPDWDRVLLATVPPAAAD